MTLPQQAYDLLKWLHHHPRCRAMSEGVMALGSIRLHFKACALHVPRCV